MRGGKPGADNRTWGGYESLALFLVVVLAGAILVSLGLRQYVGYDSFWHVFIARQDTWRELWQEIESNAHPPIYYLCLRAAMAVFGYSLLAYRMVSIAAILISIPVLARVVARVTGNRPLGVVAGAAFGLSYCAVDVGLEVRGYALLVCLLLTAFLAYLDWLDADPGRIPLRSRIVFAASLSAALLTHYAAFFFLGAALATLGLLMVADERWRVRLRTEARHHRLAFGGMFAVPVVAAAGAYLLHARNWRAGQLIHVPDFMYDPGRESVFAFLGRTTRDLVVLFFPSLGAEVAMLAAVILLGLAIWLLARQTARASLGAVPLAFLLTLLVLNAAGGLAGRYPYGGALRHEIFLFPFAVIALFTLWEWLSRSVPIAWAARKAWVGTSAVAVVVSFWLWFVPFQVSPALMKSQMDAFHAAFPRPPAVLVDQFNFILFFGHHHDWNWKLESQDRDRGMWQVWKVSKHGEQFAVCRSTQWLLDFTLASTYEELSNCMDNAHVTSVDVFRPAQPGFAATWNVEGAAGFARQIAPPLGVVPEGLINNAEDLYGAFRRASAADPEHRISVREATYGGNCGATVGNASAQVENTCADRSLCQYRVDFAVLGDPVQGCAKDFKVRWTCGRDGLSHEARISAEAGLGGVVVLTCLP